MSKEILTLGDNEIEKCKFHHCTNLSLLDDTDIENIMASSTILLNEQKYKYFVAYKDDDDHKIKPIHIMLSKMSYNGESNG